MSAILKAVTSAVEEGRLDLDESLMSDQYAQFVYNSAFYRDAHTGSAHELSYLALGAAGEAGEFADEAKKIMRVQEEEFHSALDEGIVKLVDEASDQLWYLQAFLNEAGITIEQLMAYNQRKLVARHGTPKDHMPPRPSFKTRFQLRQVTAGDHDD